MTIPTPSPAATAGPQPVALDADAVLAAAWGLAFLVIVTVVLLSRRARRHGGALRSGVVGAMYEWLDKDRQKAVDVIVEGRAAETRPEYPDGNLPDLESPKSDEKPR